MPDDTPDGSDPGDVTQEPSAAPTAEDVRKLQEALRKEREAAKAERSKASDLERRLSEIDNAGKSELQRLQEQAAEAIRRAEAAEAAALRHEVASSKGLTPAQAKRLVGATREELEADADEMLDAFQPAAGSAAPAGRPVEQLRSGAAAEPEPKEDIRSIIDAIQRSL